MSLSNTIHRNQLLKLLPQTVAAALSRDSGETDVPQWVGVAELRPIRAQLADGTPEAASVDRLISHLDGHLAAADQPDE